VGPGGARREFAVIVIRPVAASTISNLARRDVDGRNRAQAPSGILTTSVRFLIRLVLNGIAVWLAAYLLPGIYLADARSAFIAGAVLGLVNAIVRPLLVFLTLPFTFLTLGLFLLVVNGICLAIVAWMVPGFSLSGFTAAFFGALFISVVSWLLNAYAADRRRP
jgi:putative membrane protein